MPISSGSNTSEPNQENRLGPCLRVAGCTVRLSLWMVIFLSLADGRDEELKKQFIQKFKFGHNLLHLMLVESLVKFRSSQNISGEKATTKKSTKWLNFLPRDPKLTLFTPF